MRDRERTSKPLARRLRRELTKAEIVLWTRLRRYDREPHKFRRQHPIGLYVADFAHLKAKLVVELDGATHSEDAELAHDAKRTAYLASRGWRVIRFTNDDVYQSVADVVEAIWRHLDTPPSPPAAGLPP